MNNVNGWMCKVCGAISQGQIQRPEDDICANCRRSLDETEYILPHEFETEIQCLVTENHRITLRGIQQSENEYVAHIEGELAGEDPEIIRSEVRHAETFFEDLRATANRNALVSLVTRLEHRTRKLVRQLQLSTDKKSPPVARDMEELNVRLGAAAPISVQFFVDLVTARDSVIHGDSQAQWEYQGKIRRVADKYTNVYGELGFTEEHLSEAIEKVTTQVKWYDERIAASRTNGGAG
ncbi:MAG: hypothetical protein ABSF66_06575 [Terriglobales bacterium]|jgi:hypothetical protein